MMWYRQIVRVVGCLWAFPLCLSLPYSGACADEAEDLRTIKTLRDAAPEVSVPILAELLAGKRSAATSQARESLQRIGPDDALPVLERMLAGGDTRGGHAAVAALAAMGEAGLERLVELVDGRDEPLRWEAASHLGQATSGVYGDVKWYVHLLWQHVQKVRSRVYMADDAFDDPTRRAMVGLRQDLAEPDPRRRIAAMVGIGWACAGGKTAVEDIAGQLRDPSPAVVWTAADTLGRIGRPGRPALPALGGLLASDDPLVRSGALRSLGKVAPADPQVVAAALQALDDPDGHVREAGAEALASAGRAAAPAVGSLTARLGDAEPGVRAAAAHALGRVGLRSAPAAPRLLECLRDPGPAVRGRAVQALTELGVPEEALPDLVADLGSEEVAPGDAIAQLPPERTVPALIEALRSGDPSRQRAAAQTLEWVGPAGAEAIPALIESLRSVEPRPRHAAQEALIAMGPAVEPHMAGVVQVLEESAPSVQYELVRMLGEMGPEAAGAIPALLRVDPSVAPESILGPASAAAHIVGSTQPSPIVLGLAQGEDPDVRRAALDVLALAGPYTPEVVRLLAPQGDGRDKSLRGWGWWNTLGAKAAMAELVQDPDIAVRRLAVRYLPEAPADPVRAVPALIAALSDPEPDIRVSACSGLLALAKGAAPATEALAVATGDADQTVRDAASRALKVVASASGPQDPDAAMRRRISGVLYDLGHVDQATRDAAVRELSSLGAAVVPDLVEQLRSADRVRRRGAAEALRRIGGAAAPARPDLLLALDDTEKDVRVAAYGALAAIGAQPDDVPLLIWALDDADTRFAGLAGLTSLGPDAAPAVPRLVEIMQTDPLWTARNAAMSALGAAGPADMSAEPEVREALEDSRWEVRERAMQVLLVWHPDDLTPVAALLGDPDHFSTTAALRCCAKLGPAASPLLPAIREALLDANHSTRIQAAETLFAVTGDAGEALPTLLGGLGDRPGSRAPGALRALEKLGPAAAAAAPQLRPVLDHPDPQVSLPAARALWAVTGSADEVVPSLIAHLGRGGKWARPAAELLGKIGPGAEAAAPALESLRYSRDNDVYEAAATALAAIGTEP